MPERDSPARWCLLDIVESHGRFEWPERHNRRMTGEPVNAPATRHAYVHADVFRAWLDVAATGQWPQRSPPAVTGPGWMPAKPRGEAQRRRGGQCGYSD